MAEKFGKDEGAVFNMAISTLQSVRELLNDYARLSTMIEDPINNTYRKYKMAKQIYLLAVPLINDDAAKKEITAELDRLGKCFINVSSGMGGTRFGCYQNTDEEVDSVVCKIQETMQREKYFMPSKSDPKFGWKEG